MKIEMPQEPTVDRVWSRDQGTGVNEWIKRGPDSWWRNNSSGPWAWTQLLMSAGQVYTTHPDLAALDKYPAPWSASASGGTVRAKNGKVVLDPTLQCPPCLTTLIVVAVNKLAERNAAAVGEDEKR